jgi:hypothetical protein
MVVDEKGWLTSSDPRLMHAHITADGSARFKRVRRKLRLYACACCRQVWDLLDEGSRAAVEVSERYADGKATGGELIQAQQRAHGRTLFDRVAEAAVFLGGLLVGTRRLPTAEERQREANRRHARNLGASAAAEASGRAIARQFRRTATFARIAASLAAPDGLAASAAQRVLQCELLREVFGNPFRPAPPRPFPAHVIGLAQVCHETLPVVGEHYLILADALEELGEQTAADHCRRPRHVKGCHVLDWVLDKR